MQKCEMLEFCRRDGRTMPRKAALKDEGVEAIITRITAEMKDVMKKLAKIT